MKELIEDYRKRLKTIYEMILIENNVEDVIRLRTKAECYRHFIDELEKNLPIFHNEIKEYNTEVFIQCLTDTTEYPKNFIPYIGSICTDNLSVFDILKMIYDSGNIGGIWTGEQNKIREIKKVLEINDED